MCESIDPISKAKCRVKKKKHKFHLADTYSGSDNYKSTWVRIWKDKPWNTVKLHKS